MPEAPSFYFGLPSSSRINDFSHEETANKQIKTDREITPPFNFHNQQNPLKLKLNIEIL